MPLGFPVHSGGQHLVSYSQKYLPCCLLLWISFTTLFTSLRAQTLSTPVSELENHLLSVYGLSTLRIRFWFHSFLCCHSSIQDMVNQDVAIWSDSPNVVFLIASWWHSLCAIWVQQQNFLIRVNYHGFCSLDSHINSSGCLEVCMYTLPEISAEI